MVKIHPVLENRISVLKSVYPESDILDIWVEQTEVASIMLEFGPNSAELSKYKDSYSGTSESFSERVRWSEYVLRCADLHGKDKIFFEDFSKTVKRLKLK